MTDRDATMVTEMMVSRAKMRNAFIPVGAGVICFIFSLNHPACRLNWLLPMFPDIAGSV